MSIASFQGSRELGAARRIAKALRPSEDTLDTSIVASATLIASIAQARLDAGLAAEIGHDALMSAAAGMASLAQARDHVVTCHRQLAGVRDTRGMEPHDVGCTIGKYADPAKPSGMADAA